MPDVVTTETGGTADAAPPNTSPDVSPGTSPNTSPNSGAGISVTPKAIQKIRSTFAKMNAQGGLRLGVLGGGCSGLSYQFKFDAQPRPKDKVFDFDGVQIFIDPKSILYLHGLTLDYKETLMQSGFVFENPNAKKNCGCGTSFSA